MIRALLIAGVVLTGTASSVMGSIIAPSLSDEARVELPVYCVSAPTDNLLLLRVKSVDRKDSLASDTQAFSSSSSCSAFGLVVTTFSAESALPNGSATIDRLMHSPSPPIVELLRPPQLFLK